MTRLLCIATLTLLLFGCAGEDPAPARAPAPAPASPAVAVPPSASTGDAEKLVAALYRDHDAKGGPFFQTESKARLDEYFEPSLADLIWKDLLDARGEVGALDFDPLYDGQDVDPKQLTVHPARVDAASVLVPVSFDNYGEKRQLNYVLASVAGTWKISDIRYPDGRTLRNVYRPVEGT